MEYAIKIDGRYFKDYIYYHVKDNWRVGKNGLQDGDIVDITTTDKPERFDVRRSIGNTIRTLYGIEKIKGKKIEIIPLEG